MEQACTHRRTGNPAFDALAIQRSRIDARRSTDTYRIGKSLRRKGFAPTSLDDPSAVAGRVNAQLTQWIKSGGAVRIERDDPALSARRTWVCELPDGLTNIPCGGTHVHDLAEFSDITTSLTTAEIDGGLELTMETVSTTSWMPRDSTLSAARPAENRSSHGSPLELIGPPW